MVAMAAVIGAVAVWVVITSFASFRFLFRFRIWSSNAPKKVSTAWRSAASLSRGWSLLASFSTSPASSTMSLEPFFKFLRVAQASSLTESMPRRVSNASLASSQLASSSKLERMLEPVVPMRSSHQVILFMSSPTSPSWNRWSSSANQSDKTCWRWSYFGIAFPMEFILVAEKYFYKIHKFLQDTQKCRRVVFPPF